MDSLRHHGLAEPLRQAVARGTPILGICLGLQLFADASEEFGTHEGLGLVPGRVVRLTPRDAGERVPNIGWCDVRVEPSLYGASRARVLQEIQSLDTTVDSVLIAGHQPTCSEIVGSLIGSAKIRFPTAAMACIDVPTAGWEAVEFGRGFLVWFVTPKLLAGGGFNRD